MSTKRKSFRVTRNHAHLTVYPWTHPASGKARWRYLWREHETAPWRYVTCHTRAEAETSAWDKLGELDSGGLVWSALDGDTRRFLQDVHRLSKPADFQAVRAFLTSRRKSSEIVASVARFMDWKIAGAGEETRHLSNVRRDLEAMAASCAGKVVVDISPDDLKTWWDARVKGLGDKTRNEVRGNLVAFWNWCVWDGIHPKEVTAADKLPRVTLEICDRRVLTPAEFIAVAREIAAEWRPWLVLGAFCGLRPEEISPTRKKGSSRKAKRGIRCQEIDFQFKVVRVAAEVSKVKAPRHVPLSDAAVEWLAWAGLAPGMTGAVCLRNPSEEDETARLGKVVFKTGWPQDALRHSYGSFRNAIIRNLPQVAEEMGTSETMLRRHYHNPRTLEEGEAWFAMRPSLIRFDPMKPGLDNPAQELPRASNA